MSEISGYLYFMRIKKGGIMDIAIKALIKILIEEGKVCRNFETCNDVSCTSSFNSWMIAHKALSEIKGIDKWICSEDLIALYKEK